MSKFVGRLVKLGVGVEATRGAGKAPTWLLPWATLSVEDKIAKARSQGALGKLADSEEAFVTNQFAQGDTEFEFRDDVIGAFLYALFGTCSSGTVSDSAYTHTFTIDNDVDTKTLALTVEDVNTKEQYKKAMIDSLEFNATLDNTVMVTASFMCKTSDVSTVAMPSLTTESKVVKRGVKVKVATNLAGLTAATVLSIKNLRVTFAKGAVLDDALGTAEPEDILATQFAVEGELELNYEDETWKNYFRDGSVRAMEIVFENATDLIGASSYPKLTFRFPDVDFYEWEPNYVLGEPVSQRVSFKASYDVSGGNDIVSTCTLVNATVSY